MAHVSNRKELNLVVLVITIAVVILAILWYKLTLSRCSNGAPLLPPGPCSLPIVGYLPFLSPDLHKQFTNMAHTYGPIFKFYLGSKLHVVINNLELAKAVVQDQDETFANRNLTIASSVITYGGQDIVFSNNNSHSRNLRKILAHKVLSNTNLKACSSFRTDKVRKTIKNVYNRIGTNVNIGEIAFLTESNVLTRMVWDDTSYKGAKDTNLVADLAWFDLQGIERDMKEALKKLDPIFTSIIEDRVKSNYKKSEDGVGHEMRNDFLQILIDLKDQQDTSSLNITQIKALLLDIMIAGTETTATLIEWSMSEIMQNYNVLKRVQEELADIVGVNNVVEESHLSKLKYLHATIKETLRLHPVIPLLLPHSPSKDCTVGGYTIPKGCSVFLNTWSIHRDPRYWDNPLEFNPERFLTCEGGRNKWDYNGTNLKFFPFGSGRRLCPGIPLAEKMQMLILASLLHSFNWSLPKGEYHDLSENFGMTLKKRKQLIAIPSQRFPDVSLYI
ncbi:cytochrome P450 76C1-like protein [Tanacetum coccineum]